jgi:DinB superfamily
MHLEAQRFSKEVNDCRRRAEQLVSGLTAQQLTQRPEPSRWSIAECLAHLNITGNVVQKLSSAAVARAHAGVRKGKAFPIGPRARLLIWIAEPPPKFRIPAPKGIVPPVEFPDPTALLAEFMTVQGCWEKLMKAGERVDLSKIKVGSLFSPFRCRLSGGLLWMMAHQRRHLAQAENVKREITKQTSVAKA